jgi:hypothetical protein
MREGGVYPRMKIPSRSLCLLLIALVTLSGCRENALRGASGVCRSGGNLLVAGDKDGSGFFQVGIPATTGALLPLITPVSWMHIPHPEFAQDLEGIDILADGRVVVLSEKNHCLIGVEGLVVQYDETLAEIAGRGLEGVAVRPGDDGGSLVAVVWEGGYPRPDKGASNTPDTFAMLPFVVMHPLEPGAGNVVPDLEDHPPIPLHVPMPEGDEPEAQRFRAPDLVWHRFPDSTWGFIVLLSSEDLVDEPAYHHRWLQRFNLEGDCVGEPLNIETGLPENMLGLNWEGLDWFEEDTRLILVHDDPDPVATPEALLITLPEGW